MTREGKAALIEHILVSGLQKWGSCTVHLSPYSPQAIRGVGIGVLAHCYIELRSLGEKRVERKVVGGIQK